ncbi:MAG TPA: glycerophosphodiester phosphodiesterase family protein [Burkholderiales bacterium]|jgi:glycerophosphoryl diester phosphodiesterase|nr:glycerophosphodiester phosphodiesterase family protein [Burkholderiales bacterium]
MRNILPAAALTTALAVFSGLAQTANADRDDRDDYSIQLGPRPFYLVDGMDDGALKDKLMQCKNGPFRRTDFSIGHRGAALQFPEHTKESYQASARMGAGIVECDTTFTKHGDFVCRHAQNDLHTTTNILLTPLAATCIKPFTPATFDAHGQVLTPASAECRTSELTLNEFKSLRGKMDAFNPAARTIEEFVGGTPSWRTDLYTGRGTLMTLRESIELNEKNGVKHTPELKSGDPSSIASIFGGQERYAQKFADELQASLVKPSDAFPQSFNVNDVLYWINHTPYGRQAVFLVDYDAAKDNILLFDTNGKQLEKREDQLKFFAELRKAKIRIIAPAMPALLAVNAGHVVPSQLAKDLKSMGFDIITWTFERADLRQGASKAGFYYDFDPTGAAIKKDSDMYNALDVLAREVRILGIFSDWPATVSYYASCMDLK